MSSGSQIGGIIGGTIGFVASGFNPMGFKAGYLIGSAIGGYIDPVQVKGPRITDAQAMTSTVGGVITDGYGTFTTLTNVIYCSKTEEKANRSRGKGGGTKTTTYSYYRSYAIGVCVGPVDGIKWIKRNGKKVYTTDPNATAEEKQYSAKFAKKLRIYLGTEDQPVDPVMVADKGVGNVSAHLGLCYFTVEKDDLTDTGVIVPTYEVCVIKSGLTYVTSLPYAVETGETLSVDIEPADVVNEVQPYEMSNIGCGVTPAVIENRLMRVPLNELSGTMEMVATPALIENKLMRTVQTVDAGSVGEMSIAPASITLEKIRVVLDDTQDTVFTNTMTPATIEVVIP